MGKGARGGRPLARPPASRVQPDDDDDVEEMALAEVIATKPVEKKSLEEEMKDAKRCCKPECKSLCFYVIFLVTFAMASYLRRGDESAYYVVDRVKHELLEGGFDPASGAIGGAITFFDINTVTDIWNYINHDQSPLRGLLYPETWDNGDPISSVTTKSQYMPNFNNVLLGGMRIRQVRVKKDKCQGPSASIRDHLDACYAEFHSGIEDTAPFTGAHTKKVYEYKSEDETKEFQWIGKISSYGGGGYYVDMPRNLTEYKSRMSELRKDGWIQAGVTRAVFLDFQMYNPAYNLHFVGRCAFEMPAAGGIKPKADFFAFKLNAYDEFETLWGWLLLFCEIVLAVFIFFFVATEIVEMKKLGCKNYISDPWNIMDWFNIIVMTVNFGVKHLWVKLGDYPDWYKPIQEQDTYLPLMSYTIIVYMSNMLSSLNAFLLWFKLFRYLSFSPRIHMLLKTMSHAYEDILYFFIILFIFVVAFAHAGYLAFSTDVEDFRSISISIITLFNALVGSLDYEGITESSRLYGPLYFLVFQSMMILILVNVFLAIMNDAYSVVHAETIKRAKENQGGDPLGLKNISNFFLKMFHLKKKDEETAEMVELMLKKMDIDDNGVLSKDDIIHTLMSAGMSEADAIAKQTELFKKYDRNDDGELCKEEQEDMKKDITKEVSTLQKNVGKKMDAFTEMMRDLKANQMQLQETINQLASKQGVTPAQMKQAPASFVPGMRKTGWS